MNQKNLVLFFLLFIIGTIPSMAQKVNSYKLELEKFEKELEYKIIQPTYKVLVDSDDINFEGFSISSSTIDQPLELYINNDTIVVHKLMTQNNVEDDIQQVDYANALLEVNYYKNLNILMFLVHFYPCTGLGCGVNYQIIYDLKTKKTFAFGRFRTGFEMELYSYVSNIPYYLSKSYDGRNIEGIEKITYELFPIEFSKDHLQPVKNVYARSIYQEFKDEIISFEKQWLD